MDIKTQKSIEGKTKMIKLAWMAIPLSQGLYALVDGEDYEKLSEHKWYASKKENYWYAVRTGLLKENQTTIRMHREILKTSSNLWVDHINNYGLDNRRFNIRNCTRSQNQQNQRLIRKGTSKYKGVYWDKNRKKWQSRICLSNKYIYIGRYNSEIEAAKAYDQKAKELFGEFAYTNIL